MKTLTSLATAVGTVMLLHGAPVAAHHSAAGYNIDKRIEITGTVIRSTFRNPHGSLQLIVTEARDSDSGELIPVPEAAEWEVETAAANLLRRRGWDFKAVKPDMQITLVGHPTKDGSTVLYLREIHMPDGTVMGDPEGQDKALD